MTDRWVNAVVEMRVPLYGVDPDGDDGAKMDAAVAWFDALLESAPVMTSLAIARRFLIAKRFLTGEQSRAAAARRVGLSIDPKFRRSDGMRVVGPPSPPPSTVVRGGVSYGVSYYVNWNT